MKPVMTHVALHVRDLDASIAFYRDFCSMEVVHARSDSAGSRTVWIAEHGRETELVFVLISRGARPPQAAYDYSHIGFALQSREQVDEVARRARQAGCLAWEPHQEPYPVGYYCGARDPDGMIVEFSYGQPLGPGAEPIAS